MLVGSGAGKGIIDNVVCECKEVQKGHEDCDRGELMREKSMARSEGVAK